MSLKNNQPATKLTNQLTIGLVGFGVVGKGLYDVLKGTPALDAHIKRICIKDATKPRAIDKSIFTTDVNELLNDESIAVIAELIDDADAAYEIVKAALQKGKSVVSANKKMIATHFEELLYLQRKHGVAFLYEAACCAGIPIIRNLEEYYDNDLLTQVKGIINGSTNFILTKIAEEGLSFAEALKAAQELGFAESNPALDIEGHDAANKLVILAAHAFGTIATQSEILYSGITAVKEEDAAYAKEKGSIIKLVAHAKKINDNELAAFVLPQLVKADDDLFNVKNEFNALETESCFADKHFFKGRGAGAYPTAAAVLSDISALRYDYKYEYKKINQPEPPAIAKDYLLNVIISATDAAQINDAAFTHIAEWHDEIGYVRIRGTINAAHLKNDNWWRASGVSLVLCGEALGSAAVNVRKEQKDVLAKEVFEV
jgi:homoserine dehydrogenase